MRCRTNDTHNRYVGIDIDLDYFFYNLYLLTVLTFNMIFHYSSVKQYSRTSLQ